MLESLRVTALGSKQSLPPGSTDLVTLVCFRFLYKTDGGSNGPILVPISRQHYLPDPVNQGNHVVYPSLFAIPHSSAGSPLALSGTPSASYHAA